MSNLSFQLLSCSEEEKKALRGDIFNWRLNLKDTEIDIWVRGDYNNSHILLIIINAWEEY